MQLTQYILLIKQGCSYVFDVGHQNTVRLISDLDPINYQAVRSVCACILIRMEGDLETTFWN